VESKRNVETGTRPIYPPQRHNPSPKSNRKWLPYAIIGGSAAVGILMVSGMVALLLVMYLAAPRIPSGVSVAGITIGGESAQDVQASLQALSDRAITATDGNRTWQIYLRDLGVRLDTEATIQAAEDAAPGSAVEPRYTIDLNQAQMGLVYLSDLANIAAVPGNPPQMGRAMDIPVTLDRLRADVSGELGDGILDLDMVEVEPAVSEGANPYTGETTIHVVQAGQELGLIAKEYGVDMQDIISINGITNPDLLYIGQELTIPAGGVYQPTQVDAPAPPTTSGKSIVVSTQTQRIYAYENGVLVRSHLVSTGLPKTPTVLGDYSVYVKYVADDMAGPDYFLPQVPYTMYFFQGYGIHGTYWHNNFGRPMSHGCVNLPTSEAEWFFNWASVGTPVRVV
jgi:lipoprotein-anchoring transpeptidase ErfK/SrfK